MTEIHCDSHESDICFVSLFTSPFELFVSTFQTRFSTFLIQFSCETSAEIPTHCFRLEFIKSLHSQFPAHRLQLRKQFDFGNAVSQLNQFVILVNSPGNRRRRFFARANFPIAISLRMLSNTVNDSVVRALSNCIHCCCHDCVALFAFPMTNSNFRRQPCQRCQWSSPIVDRYRCAGAVAVRWPMAGQYVLRLRPLDVEQTSTMNVYMRRLVVRAIQLYDIIPVKERKKNKLVFGGKKWKLKTFQKSITLEFWTLCGD